MISFTDIRYDKETRVVVLTGVGEHFCAGQDLKQYSLEMESQPARLREDVREKVRVWRKNLLRLYRRLKRRGITAAIQCRMSDTKSRT